MMTKARIKMAMLLPLFAKAWKGRKAWLKMKSTYVFTNYTYLVVFADENEELNASALRNLPEFLKYYHMDKAVVACVSDSSDLRLTTCNEDQQIIEMACLPREEIANLLQYYLFTQFYDFIKVISLKEPFGYDGLLSAELPGVDMDYFVNVYFYGTGVGF